MPVPEVNPVHQGNGEHRIDSDEEFEVIHDERQIIRVEVVRHRPSIRQEFMPPPFILDGSHFHSIHFMQIAFNIATYMAMHHTHYTNRGVIRMFFEDLVMLEALMRQEGPRNI